MSFILFYFIVISIGALAFYLLLKSRNLNIWITSYLKQFFKRKHSSGSIKHIYFCLADHYEPYVGKVKQDKAHARVSRWITEYRNIAKHHSDSYGRPPQHSYFYPEEEYDEWVINKLSEICKDNLGDLDIHLHHDDDTAENLEITLTKFKELLYEKHGLLRKNENNEIVYGFIHGNWALDNSRPDGKWCGVNNEIEVLLKTGCVFDMTMPSAPSDTQTSIINSLYFAKETGFCKSHNTGTLLEGGYWGEEGKELLMIQGPLTLNWSSRKLGILPRIESGELSNDSPPNVSRVDLWEKYSPRITCEDDHIFIKLHTHGVNDSNTDMFFNQNGFDDLWSMLEAKYKNNSKYKLHYVTAWEMFLKIKNLSLSNANKTVKNTGYG